MEVAVIGAGYVGLTTAACLASHENRVTCIDTDGARVAALNAGRMPIYEPGLDVVIEKAAKARRLRFTTDVATNVGSADIVFLAVGTPSAADGGVDLSQIEAAAASIGPHLKSRAVVVIKSTVPPGTAQRVSAILQTRASADGVTVVSNPEFLREGSALKDCQHPDRIVIGSFDDHGAAMMRKLYSPFGARNVPFVMTTPANAELIKYAANAFLAMKIGFINDIADLCEKIGGDVGDVARGIGLDARIGTAFLQAGPGYGGSCFPKDTRGLAHAGKAHGAPQPLVELVIERNENRMRKIARRVLDALRIKDSESTARRQARVAIFGLAFKPETDDMRDAPSLTVISMLQKEGVTVSAHDPHAMANARALLDDVELCTCPYEAAKDADAIVLLTEWSSFRALDIGRLAGTMRGQSFFDYRNAFKPNEILAHGLDYFGVGRPAQVHAPAE